MVKKREMEGVIFDIKRFAVHDGPGIRTSIFLKGCPLSCVWCHNPEGITREISLWYHKGRCITCGRCISVCPEHALEMNTGKNAVEIDHSQCSLTGNCLKVCPTGALQHTGKTATVREIMDEVEKDEVFYRTSGGGITLTGGEPLYQPGFCSAILEESKDRGFHTALDSCLFCDRQVLKDVLDLVDLYIIDLKLFNPEEHKLYTGKGNEIIINNLRYLVDLKKKLIIRVPLIRDITDTVRNKTEIERFLQELDPGLSIEYLEYNPLAENKYRKLGIPYFFSNES